MQWKPVTTAALWIGLMLCQPLWAANYYRYENEDGRKVITQTLPPEVVGRGYEVLNERGMVVEVVPRALTPEELAAKAEEERERQRQAERAERDRQLLAIFSSPRDAERARDRKLEAIDAYIKITQGNIQKLQKEYEIAQGQAAERELAGQPVPDYLISKMQSFARQIREAEESIEEKEGEKTEIRTEYQEDIERLRYLMEQQQAAENP